ncbi:MAG: hypothetical protein KA190_24785 [Kofleriaceae bacterium]|nr:hypothetical protein [Kofleriaceae bacterium]
MKRSLAAVLAIATLSSTSAGCFPHNKKHRHIALAAEAGVAVAGIAVLAASGTGADCKFLDEDCKSGANTGSLIGVGLLLAGLGGLITTISTAESGEQPAPLPPLPTAEAEPAPAAAPAPVAAPVEATPTPTEATPTAPPSPPPETGGPDAGSPGR